MKGKEAKGFTSERGRFETFNNWPRVQTATPNEFVQAGFYYSGNSDKVICTFCNGELSSWGPSDNPMEQHRLHFPECIFVLHSSRSSPKAAAVTPGTSKRSANVELHQNHMNYRKSTVSNESCKNCGAVLTESRRSGITNSPLPEAMATTSYPESYQRMGLKLKNDRAVNNDQNDRAVNNDQKAASRDPFNFQAGLDILTSTGNIGIAKTTTHKEQYFNSATFNFKPLADYTVERVRLQSFKNWPLEYPNVVELARAGFYYIGPYDLVKCFACGGLIKSWNRDDDPWIEHAKFFPGCKYLHICLGEDVVKEIHGAARRQFSNDLEEDGTR